jgi:acylphosphatase
VGFRFTACNIAKRCLLAGIVRNLADGTVEMIVQGKTGDISDCIRNIKETFEAGIREIKINEIPLNPEFTDFRITF